MIGGLVMLQILGILIGILLVIVLVVLVVAATRPGGFRVERTTKVQAPPERLFALLNDFHQWSSWSPWEKLDPAMARSHGGAASGKGAIYEWKGNRKVGQGRMEITESVPTSKITIQLDFLEPFQAHNIAEFTLQAQGETTSLTWAMICHRNFMMKVMSIFMDMDRMIGKDFETGLANLRSLVETGAVASRAGR
jgi:uncharacterized protein YndB with AHSA1/START domain